MITTTTTTTIPTFFLRFAAQAALCLIILVSTFQVQEAYGQNVDQLTKKQGTDFPANFLKMNRSDLNKCKILYEIEYGKLSNSR